ncbi:hypothetical protein MZH07_28700, partial [Escherichia coli]|nr:hypothetical protein [Escherichia coli]
QRGKPPEWWEKQKGSRGIRRGQWYRLVFQFPIRELVRTFLSSEYFDDLPAYILDTETMLMGINRKNRNVNDYNRAIRSN